MNENNINNGNGNGNGIKKHNIKAGITTEFPEPPLRCNFGLALTEANLSYRTRQLDAWLRDVCCCYKYMLEIERAAVRYFLDFDMTRPIDISIQDRLARGLVEAPRAIVLIPTGFGGNIREKDVNEINEVMSDVGGGKDDKPSKFSIKLYIYIYKI